METIINNCGEWFCDYGVQMVIQSGALIVAIFLLDLLIRKRVRAVVRYCMWMLILVKLVLPTSLSMPTGIGYWFGMETSTPTAQNTAANPVEANITSTIPAEVAAAEIFNSQPLMEQPSEAMPLGAGSFPEPAIEPTAYTATATESEPVTTAEPLPATQNAQIQDVTTIAPAAPAITVKGWLFIGWMVGVLVLTLLLIQRFWFVRSLIRQASPATDPQILATLEQARQTIGLGRAVELRLTTNMLSPAACGVIKPVILMPAELAADLATEKLYAVLMHELCHIKRGDLLVNLAQTLLQIINFYNPLLWPANAMIRGLREKAVDEAVLSKMQSESQGYCNALIDIAEIAFSRPALALRLIGVVESKTALRDRIKHITSRPLPHSARLGWISTAAVIILAAVMLPMAKGTGQGKTDTDNKTEAVTPVNTDNGSIAQLSDKNLRSTIIEQKNILLKKLDDLEKNISAGRTDSHELNQAKIDLLWVEIQLAETSQEQIEILEKIVELYKEQEKRTQLLIAAGRAVQNDLDEIILKRLGVEKEIRAVMNNNTNITETPGNTINKIELANSTWKMISASGDDSTKDINMVKIDFLPDNKLFLFSITDGHNVRNFNYSYTLNNGRIDISDNIDKIKENIFGYIDDNNMELYLQESNIKLSMKKVDIEVADIKDLTNSTWEMTDISGNGADGYNSAKLYIKPDNKVRLEADMVNGPTIVDGAYVLADGTIFITNDDNGFRMSGAISNDTMELASDNGDLKVTLKRIADSWPKTNSTTATVLKQSDLLGKWKSISIKLDGKDVTNTEDFPIKYYILDFKSDETIIETSLYLDGTKISDSNGGTYTLSGNDLTVFQGGGAGQKIFKKNGTILNGKMTLTQSDKDHKFEMELEKVKTATPAITNSANELSGRWKMISASGDEADEINMITIDFKPNNKVAVLAENTDGPYSAIGSYTLYNGNIQIIDDSDPSNKLTGFINSDNTLELIEKGSDIKVILKPVDSPATTTTNSEPTVKLDKLLGEWVIVDTVIYINVPKSNYTGTFDFKTSDHVVFEGKYSSSVGYVEDMEYSADDQGRIEIISADTDTKLIGYLKDDTLQLIDSDGSAKLTLKRTNDKKSVLTPQLLGKWSGVESNTDSTIEITLDFKNDTNVVMECNDNRNNSISDYPYVFKGNNRILINFQYSGYINDDSIELIYNNKRVVLFKSNNNTNIEPDNAELKINTSFYSIPNKGLLSSIKDFLTALQTEDVNKLLNSIYVENDLHRNSLISLSRDFNPSSKESTNIKFEVVEVYPGDNNTYMVLILTNANTGGDVFYPQTIILKKDDTGFKVNSLSSKELKEIELRKTMSVAEYGQKIYEDQRNQWIDANSEQLKTLRQNFISKQQRQLDAIKYARENNIKLFKPFDNEEQFLKTLEVVQSLSPEETRDMVLNELDNSIQNNNSDSNITTNKAVTK